MYSQQQMLAGATAGYRVPDRLPQARMVLDPSRNVTMETRAILANTTGGTNNKQCLICSSPVAAGTAGSPDFSASQPANGNTATAGQFGVELWRNISSQVTGSLGCYYSNDRINNSQQTNGRPHGFAIRCANGSQNSNYNASSFTATLSGTTLTATTSVFSAGSVGKGVTDGSGNWVVITAYSSGTVVTVAVQRGSPSWTGSSLTMYTAGSANLFFNVWASTSAGQSSGGAFYTGNTFSAPVFWSSAYCSFDLPNGKVYVYFDGLTTPEILTLNSAAIYLLISQSPVPCIGGCDNGTSSPSYSLFQDGVIGPVRLYAGRPDDATIGVGTSFISTLWNNGWPLDYATLSFAMNAVQGLNPTKALSLVASWSCTTGDPVVDDTGNNGNMVTALGSGGSGTVGSIPLVREIVDRAKGIPFAPLTYGYAYRWIANGFGTGLPCLRGGATSGMEAAIPSTWLTDVSGDIFIAFQAASFVTSTDANFLLTICNNATYTAGHDPQYFIVMAEYESPVTGTVSSSGTTVTATGSIFAPGFVGAVITDGTHSFTITGYTSATQVTVNSAPGWTSQSITVNVGGGPTHGATGDYITTQLRGYIGGVNQSMQASGTIQLSTNTPTIANIKALGTGFATTADGNGNYTAADWEFAISTSGSRGQQDPTSARWAKTAPYINTTGAMQNVYLGSMSDLSTICIGHLNYNDGNPYATGQLRSGIANDESQAFWDGDIGFICVYGSRTVGNVATGQAALPPARNFAVQKYLCDYYGM